MIFSKPTLLWLLNLMVIAHRRYCSPNSFIVLHFWFPFNLPPLRSATAVLYIITGRTLTGVKDLYFANFLKPLWNSRIPSTISNLSARQTFFDFLSNQRILPVRAGINDPEMCRISSSKLKESNVRTHIFQWKSISFLGMINSKRAISHLLTKNCIMVPTFITCRLCDLLANTSSPYFYLMKKKISIMTLNIYSRKIKRQEWGMGRNIKNKMDKWYLQ